MNKEQVIETLDFLANKSNYAELKYAMDCVEKIEHIKKIIDDPCFDFGRNKYLEIKAVINE